jgi:nucleoside-diphosphate-sugar epimerase
MNYLITGSEGFVGRYACELLLAQGHEVWGCDRAIRSQDSFRQLEGETI